MRKQNTAKMRRPAAAAGPSRLARSLGSMLDHSGAGRRRGGRRRQLPAKQSTTASLHTADQPRGRGLKKRLRSGSLPPPFSGSLGQLQKLLCQAPLFSSASPPSSTVAPPCPRWRRTDFLCDLPLPKRRRTPSALPPVSSSVGHHHGNGGTNCREMAAAPDRGNREGPRGKPGKVGGGVGSSPDIFCKFWRLHAYGHALIGRRRHVPNRDMYVAPEATPQSNDRVKKQPSRQTKEKRLAQRK
jgi:hypothetical protein